jgi:serine/threonine-protein kinase TTK/MPS1
MRSPPLPSSASPTTVEALPTRLSPSARTYFQSGPSSSAPVRHRRSPTAPEPPTTSGMLGSHGQSLTNLRTTWAAGESVPEESLFGRGAVERARSTTPSDPPLVQHVQQPSVAPREQSQPHRAAPAPPTTRPTAPALAATNAASDTRNRQIIV